MANYLVNHRKKKNILEKRKQELAHAIRNQFSPDKVDRAIERLRFAQLQVFKCELHREPGQGKDANKVREEQQRWENLSADEIIKEFVKEYSSAQ